MEIPDDYLNKEVKCVGCGSPFEAIEKIEMSLPKEDEPVEYEEDQVVITDIKMPFWSMVTFMVKASIAFIPASIILSIIGAIIFGILSVMLASFSAY